jgi:hypothetical protein
MLLCPVQVSHHRYHHLHCDTPLDPHSPYEGFFWAHILWLLGTETVLQDRFNTPDMNSQWWYRFLEATFFPQIFIIKPLLFYYFGGLEMVVWGICVPTVCGWHATFLVNSAAHTWGRQPYETGNCGLNHMEGRGIRCLLPVLCHVHYVMWAGRVSHTGSERPPKSSSLMEYGASGRLFTSSMSLAARS